MFAYRESRHWIRHIQNSNRQVTCRVGFPDDYDFWLCVSDGGERLSETDADYVDVIHTDAGVFGIPDPIGHADFYPNEGRALQPGCQPGYLARHQETVEQVCMNDFFTYFIYFYINLLLKILIELLNCSNVHFAFN